VTHAIYLLIAAATFSPPRRSCTKMTWVLTLLLCLAALVPASARIHSLHIVDDPRTVFSIESFGFQNGGRFALDIHDGDGRDREALTSHGWRLVPPAETVGTPQSFQKYIQNSAAEFSVAQGVYAHAQSGWFSDRSATYLASGRPVVTQDTGFGRVLPVGVGLHPWRTLDEAVVVREAAGARTHRKCPHR
jgi:hypothetical protein